MHTIHDTTPEVLPAPDDDDDDGIDLDSLLAALSERFSNDDDDDIDDDNDEIPTATEFHNKACRLAKERKFSAAKETCIKGLAHYPNDKDLLADTITYSCDCGDYEQAEESFRQLSETPTHLWNWRCFTFSINYLKDTDVTGNEKEIRGIIADYRKFLPHEEKSYVAESELEDQLGNAEASYKILTEAVSTHSCAPQCAIRLADIQIEAGLYAEALKTTEYAMACCEVQGSINMDHIIFVNALCRDHLLRQKPSVTKAEVLAMDAYYAKIDKLFHLIQYHVMITERRNLLQLIDTED